MARSLVMMAKLIGEALYRRLADVTLSVLVHDCSKTLRVTVPACPCAAAAARGVACPPLEMSEVRLVMSKTSSWLVPATTCVGLGRVRKG
eukprot:scaffold106932_cov64-Phaeocystis_antarctica.AAC.1